MLSILDIFFEIVKVTSEQPYRVGSRVDLKDSNLSAVHAIQPGTHTSSA